MEEKRFQTQKLNKKDHKKIDDAVKNAKIGIGAGGVLLVAVEAVTKLGPKVIKKIIKI